MVDFNIFEEADKKSEIYRDFKKTQLYWEELGKIEVGLTEAQKANFLDVNSPYFKVVVYLMNACNEFEIAVLQEQVNTILKQIQQLQEQMKEQIKSQEEKAAASKSSQKSAQKRLKKLTDTEKKILHALVFGQPLEEIAKETGTTAQNISYFQSKFGKLNLI